MKTLPEYYVDYYLNFFSLVLDLKFYAPSSEGTKAEGGEGREERKRAQSEREKKNGK